VAALALENQLKDQTEEVQRLVEEVKRQVHEIQGLRQSMGSLQEQADRLQENLHQRTWERDELQRSPEFRVGHMLLNKARFRAPLRLLERAWIRLQHLWSLVRLRLEGSVLRRKRTLPYKGMATICWNFPIYSHTFVYQELTQLNRRGFDLRIVFSKLDPRPYLHKQFDHLWRMKRRMALHKSLYRVDRQYFQSKMPEKVEQITDMICKASGRDRDYVESHDNFLQAFSYARMVEAYGPDYLHSYFFYDRSLFSMVAAFLLDLPRGVSCYADHVMDDYEFKLVPLHMQTCDVVIATSKRIKRELLEVAPAADPDKILVKPNAVDAERFPVLERHEPAPGQPYRIVCVCRIEPKKGLTYLARAMALLRDRGVKVEAHIVGEADEGIQSSQDYRLRLCQVLDELDLWGTVHLEGRQELDGVRRFLEISQLFVAPFVETDSGDKDGIPTALLESMATGLPAVASDAGSIVEVITPDKDGLIVPMRDAEALADALQDLLQDPERRAAMSTAAAEKVRREFDVQVCEKWFHDRVIDLLAARRRPS
jgi:glycosyltransferase involved in cell wall biosynthesis